MKTIIQHNCLVILIGPSGAGKSTFATNNFKPYEIISSDTIRHELCHDFMDNTNNKNVFDKFYNDIEFRLKNGLRVVADATNLRTEDRQKLVNIAKIYNNKIYYVIINNDMETKRKNGGWRNEIITKHGTLIDRHQVIFESEEKRILRGDENKEVIIIDTRKEKYNIINTIHDNELSFLNNKNVRIIGDVHGNLNELNSAINTDNFIIFLGDIVDYGEHSIQCADIVMDMVNNGKAFCIRGNHEKKIAKLGTKFIETGRYDDISMSHGNKITFESHDNNDNAITWFKKFISFNNIYMEYIRFNNAILAHAAVHEKLWDNSNRFKFKLPEGPIHSHCMYGQTTGEFLDNYPVRIYDWVDKIPNNNIAIVGHDIRSVNEPFVQISENGGKAIFLDTGSSKGGKLSYIDCMIDKDNNLIF